MNGSAPVDGDRSQPASIHVWAPLAKTVALRMKGSDLPMIRDEFGTWRAEVRGDLHDLDYEFVVDGSALPDPRSPSQPQGVHGASRFVDHAKFRWNDGGWQPPPLRSGVIYELHVGTFTPEGTFESAIARLDHLVGLGITHVELMPVAEFPGDRGWGYDGVDLYAPHHAYGGPEGLKRLVDACHQRGLAVLLDVVYNHLGPDGNYLSKFGPYLTDRHQTPWGQAINLDGEGSCEVRRFLMDNALMWLRDYHFDGLRLDAVHALFDSSAVHFLEQLAREVDQLEAALGRTLVLIAESDLNDPRIVQRWEAGGYGMGAQWSDDFHHAMHVCLTGERHGYYSDFSGARDVKKALEKAFVYDGRYSRYRERAHGRPAVGVPEYRFVICLQNHDQVGNRAAGERSSQLMGREGLLTGAAVLLTAANVPMLFQGEEWGASTPFQYFTAHTDAEMARSVSEGRRREFTSFGWRPEEVPDPQSPSTFERSKLNWPELDKEPHRTVLEWYRALIRLRRSLNGSAAHIQLDGADTLHIERGPVSVTARLEAHQPWVEVRLEAERVLNTQEAESTEMSAAI